MTYEEKLKFAFNVVVKYGFCGDCRWTFNSDKCHEFDCYQNGVAIIKQALEKQVPKKPILRRQIGLFTIYLFHCPVCDDALISEWNKNIANPYCHHCGQAIDWSDEDAD